MAKVDISKQGIGFPHARENRYGRQPKENGQAEAGQAQEGERDHDGYAYGSEHQFAVTPQKESGAVCRLMEDHFSRFNHVRQISRR
jgi:hypothetical protein